jgi:elongation factor Ts
MTAITADLVKDLRDRTGAGMMDCKAALQSTAGDMEKAIDVLRKKGLSQAAKRAGREAKEGFIIVKQEGQKAAILETNCETDFVARTDDFKALGALATQEVFAHGEKGIASEKVTQSVADLSGKIGEKIVARRAKLLEAKEGVLFTYLHSNQKLGVIVELALSNAALKNDAGFEELGKNIAMQIAASNPICLARTEVPAATIEREKAIFREEIKGKPENIVEKIIQGKLDKFYQNNCLLEQPFVKDDKVSVQELLNQAAKKLGGSTIQIKQFTRFQLGETLPS